MENGGFMKGKLYSLLAFIVLSGWMVSCKTASKLYDNGNYDEAVDLAVKKLQKKPGNGEIRALLQNAYRYAVNDHEARIRNHFDDNNELKWEWIYNEYASLQRLYDAIRRSPEASNIVRAADYSSYMSTYRDKAADARYERGLRWMESNDRMGYRNAFTEFQAALGFKPGDFAIKSKMDEAYNNAVMHVVVMPVDNFNYRYSSQNDYELRNLEHELLRNLQYNTNTPFVKFYSMWEARSHNIQPDQFIDIRFNTMNIGRYRDDRSTKEVSKEVVIKETVYRPDSIVKEYGRVTARITTTRRTMHSDGNLLVNIRDNDNRWVWNDNFRGDHNWTTEFATYTGDERALSETDKQLINRRPESAPHEDEIMRFIIREINNNLHYRIRDFYNRY
jgi:hypothetical protein